MNFHAEKYADVCTMNNYIPYIVQNTRNNCKPITKECVTGLANDYCGNPQILNPYTLTIDNKVSCDKKWKDILDSNVDHIVDFSKSRQICLPTISQKINGPPLYYNPPIPSDFIYSNPYDTDQDGPSEIIPIYYPEGNYLSYGPWGYDQGVYYPDRRSTRPLYGNDRHDRHRHDRHKHEKKDQTQQQTPWQQTQQQTQQQAPWQQTQQVPRKQVRQQTQPVQQVSRQQFRQQTQPRGRTGGRTVGRRREDFEEGINNKEKENTVCLTHEDYKKLDRMAHK